MVVMVLLVAAAAVALRVLGALSVVAAAVVIGTWLVPPEHVVELGVRDLAVGYATYLILCGLRTAGLSQLALGVGVTASWGATLLWPPAAGDLGGSGWGYLFAALGGLVADRISARSVEINPKRPDRYGLVPASRPRRWHW